MKKYNIIIFIVGLFAFPLLGMAGGISSPEKSLIDTRDLHLFSTGIGFDTQKRNIINNNKEMGLLQSRHLYALISYDVFSWLTFNAGFGKTEVKPESLSKYDDSKFMWKVETKANLWQYSSFEKSFLDWRSYLQVASSYWKHKAEFNKNPMEWTESRTKLILHTEYFVKDKGPHDFVYSVAFLAGAVYSNINIDFTVLPEWFNTQTGNIEEDQSTGLVLGVDMKFTRNFGIGWESLIFDHSTHSVSIFFHF